MSSAERDALIDRIGKILVDWLRKDSHVVVGPILDVIKERETAMREECAMIRKKLNELDMFHRQKIPGPCDLEGGECTVCSILDCPEGEALHYHHDGCPICSFKDAAAIRGTEQDGGD